MEEQHFMCVVHCTEKTLYIQVYQLTVKRRFPEHVFPVCCAYSRPASMADPYAKRSSRDGAVRKTGKGDTNHMSGLADDRRRSPSTTKSTKQTNGVNSVQKKKHSIRSHFLAQIFLMSSGSDTYLGWILAQIGSILWHFCLLELKIPYTYPCF